MASAPPVPRGFAAFRSRMKCPRRKNGARSGACARACRAAFRKHVFPRFCSPTGRRSRMCRWAVPRGERGGDRRRNADASSMEEAEPQEPWSEASSSHTCAMASAVGMPPATAAALLESRSRASLWPLHLPAAMAPKLMAATLGAVAPAVGATATAAPRWLPHLSPSGLGCRLVTLAGDVAGGVPRTRKLPVLPLPIECAGLALGNRLAEPILDGAVAGRDESPA
mmetsp:Transcript_82333/g.233236  ORF Transcript_82333/g.233236 Transcript_82333/m.233236 type:complete len:225 (+) Transcript_82333:1189-1863(+)